MTGPMPGDILVAGFAGEKRTGKSACAEFLRKYLGLPYLDLEFSDPIREAANGALRQEKGELEERLIIASQIVLGLPMKPMELEAICSLVSIQQDRWLDQ